MNTYKVTERVNLTVEEGSKVILTDEQYEIAKDYLTPDTKQPKKSTESVKPTEN